MIKASNFGLRFIAFLLLANTPLIKGVHAMPYPDTGWWWNSDRSGEGLFIERQGDMIGFALFSHTHDGEPVFYVGGGPMVEGGYHEPTGWREGYLPLHAFVSRLYRTRNGPMLNNLDSAQTESEDVGSVVATFQYSGQLLLDVYLSDPPPGAAPATRRYYSRFSFGYGGFGSNLILRTPCWVDLRGKWVFVDESSDAARDAWAYDFDVVEVSPATETMTCPGVGRDHVVLYRDTTADVTLRCVFKTEPAANDPDVATDNARCVLRDAGGDALLWFSTYDIGLKQVAATLGPPPPLEQRVLRGPARVLGMRIR